MLHKIIRNKKIQPFDDEIVMREIGIGGYGKAADVKSDACMAKTRHSKTKTHWVKMTPAGIMADFRNVSREKMKFVKVSEKVFDSYKLYLVTGSELFLHKAEREYMNG